VFNLALHYNLGFMRPMIYVAQGKTDANGKTQAKVVMLGTTAVLGQGLLKAMIYRLDSEDNSRDRSKFGLGYNYAMSKRTTVYADVGLARQTGLTNNTAYALGVKHTF
jgi:predicted porin